MWRNSESDVKPLEIEEGLSTVYVRRNIVQHEATDEKPVTYTYEEIEYDKAVYPLILQIEEQKLDIAAMAELL